jgi:hypothetical protein
VGVERGKTAVGFGACNEKQIILILVAAKRHHALRSRLGSKEGDYNCGAARLDYSP